MVEGQRHRKTARRHHLCGITTPRTQTEPRRRAELRVTIQSVSGDAMTADLLLSEIEASLGNAWRLDVLEERNGTARTASSLMGSDASGMKNKCCSKN